MHGFGISTAVGQLEEDLITCLGLQVSEVVHPVTADSPGKFHVLFHDSHSFGMDGAEIRVLKDTDNVGLGRLLKSVQCL